MKKFQFTLQKLADVKASEEEKKRIELEELDRKQKEEQNKLNVLVQSFDKQKGDFEKRCETGIGKDDLKNFGDYFNYLNEEIKQQQKVVEECIKATETCRTQLLKLINEQKVLDQMREDQLRAYNEEVQKAFDKEIEDFMQSRM